MHSRLRSRATRWIFRFRLWLGLAFAAGGAAIARPHTLWGASEEFGTAASIATVVLGMALRFWAAGSTGGHTHSGEIEGGRLATGGPYAFVRNPIYLGSMILGLGMVGLIGDGRLLPIAAAAFVFLYCVIIPAEERFLAANFGAEYDRFRASVPKLIPRLSQWHEAEARPFNWTATRGEIWILVTLLLIYGTFEAVSHLSALGRSA